MTGGMSTIKVLGILYGEYKKWMCNLCQEEGMSSLAFFPMKLVAI